MRYKGIVCDKCGVEVAPSRVRRERMGHIELASPVSHIWYVKGVPCRLGLLLNISPRHLERVLYFAQYIVTNVNEDARSRAIQRHERELQMRMQRMDGEIQEQVDTLQAQIDEALGALDREESEEITRLDTRINEQTSAVIAEAQKLQSWIQSNAGKKAPEDKFLSWSRQAVLRQNELASNDYVNIVNDLVQQQIDTLQAESDEQKADIRMRLSAKREFVHRDLGGQLETLRGEVDAKKDTLRAQMERALDDVKSLEEKQLLSENRYRELAERWGNVFTGGMGAEAVRDIVAKLDLERMSGELRREMRTTKSKQRRKKAAKRLRVVENFRKSGNRPEWMILTALPVIPPELRPMVQLDGGRFATSDLNDLYRRVHQPQQPAQAAHGARRARRHRAQRKAHAAGSRRLARRQRPPRPRRQPFRQAQAQEPFRPAQGQAGTFPPQPARQARRLLRPFRHRHRPHAQAAPVRPAQENGARALQALRHAPPRRKQLCAQHQECQAHGRPHVARSLGRPRRDLPRASRAAQPCADPPPPGHSGL